MTTRVWFPPASFPPKASMKIADVRQELEFLDRVEPLAGERYASCLATYEAASTQRSQIAAWFEGDVVPELSPESARVLSVGCGAGDLDRKLLAAGARHAGNRDRPPPVGPRRGAGHLPADRTQS